MDGSGRKMVAVNKRARYEFELIQTYEAGLVLTGTEVKSLREGKISLREAYGRTDGRDIYLHGLDIAQYGNAGHANHDPKRKRKLLLKHGQLRKIIPLILQRGLTLVPTSIYFKRGWAKVEIAIARGKKLYDKREVLRRREQQRDIKRAMKGVR